MRIFFTTAWRRLLPQSPRPASTWGWPWGDRSCHTAPAGSVSRPALRGECVGEQAKGKTAFGRCTGRGPRWGATARTGSDSHGKEAGCTSFRGGMLESGRELMFTLSWLPARGICRGSRACLAGTAVVLPSSDLSSSPVSWRPAVNRGRSAPAALSAGRRPGSRGRSATTMGELAVVREPWLTAGVTPADCPRRRLVCRSSPRSFPARPRRWSFHRRARRTCSRCKMKRPPMPSRGPRSPIDGRLP